MPAASPLQAALRKEHRSEPRLGAQPPSPPPPGTGELLPTWKALQGQDTTSSAQLWHWDLCSSRDGAVMLPWVQNGAGSQLRSPRESSHPATSLQAGGGGMGGPKPLHYLTPRLWQRVPALQHEPGSYLPILCQQPSRCPSPRPSGRRGPPCPKVEHGKVQPPHPASAAGGSWSPGQHQALPWHHQRYPSVPGKARRCLENSNSFPPFFFASLGR